MTEQTTGQETPGRYPNRYPKGVSGNPAGRLSIAEYRARVDAKARELAAELGGLRDFLPSSEP
jgi:hypothetical protein